MSNVQLTQSQRNAIDVVESFLAALVSLDMDRILSHLADDIEYQNVPLPPDRGKAQVERTMRLFGRVTSQFEVQTHHIAAQGNVVLTERTDVLRGRFLDITIWVCGTFEVRDGKIALWRDHFDVASFALQLLTSPVRRLLSTRG
jgi:limonene-1,2-epoxide hydrolase